MALRIRASSSSSLNPVGKEKFLGFVLCRRLLSEDPTAKPNPSILNEKRCNVKSQHHVNASSGKSVRKCWPWESSASTPSSKENFTSFSSQEDQGLLNAKQLKLAVDQEDDFDELGSPVVDADVELLKNPECSRKTMADEPIVANPAASSLHVIYDEDRFMKPLPEPQTCTWSSRQPSGNLNGSAGMKFASGRGKLISDTSYNQKVSRNAIVIEKVPSSITLQQLEEVVSIFGEIQTSFMRTFDNGLCSCHIEYKSFESKTRAIAAGCISVEGHLLPVCDLPASFCAAVRIYNINVRTVEPIIHSVCMSCAPVRSLIRSSVHTVDVHFSIGDHTAMPDILLKLNNVKVDGCQWSARLVENDAVCRVKPEAASTSIESQISNLILDIKKQTQLKRVYLEDLEELHDAIVHLTDCPLYH